MNVYYRVLLLLQAVMNMAHDGHGACRPVLEETCDGEYRLN